MKAIVCVDEKWGIGKNNDLLFSLPLDMKFFRETTKEKVVVMGANTLKSFPNEKPLSTWFYLQNLLEMTLIFIEILMTF